MACSDSMFVGRPAVVLLVLATLAVSACGGRRRPNALTTDAGEGLDAFVIDAGRDLGLIDLGREDLGASDAGPMTDLGVRTDAGPPRCGNRIVDLGETCDGTNLNGETCVSLGYASGSLSCNLTCSDFSTVACVSPATHAPSVTSFTMSPSTLTPSTTVTLTAVATDADGVADLATAEVYDELGNYYTTLSRSGGTFTGTLTWNDVNYGETIEFTGSGSRSLIVTVTDYEGYEATRSLNVPLSCGVVGYGACAGTCTALNTSMNCGACGVVCDGSCSTGTCACAPGTTNCGGICLAHVSGGCDEPADGDLGTGPTGLLFVYHTGMWRGICDDGFSTTASTVACQQFGSTHLSTSTSATGPSSEFWLDSVYCSGSETRIDACSHDSWGYDDCSSSEWIQLTCN
ncbi:MAG: scavenger receptor cysteine-rich domain-containing protein [Sandaracinaceae bacterium]|nr:scavenger receptor cysteine-rich domain-containing protein [Sandaracinaceae bacterium]